MKTYKCSPFTVFTALFAISKMVSRRVYSGFEIAPKASSELSWCLLFGISIYGSDFLQSLLGWDLKTKKGKPGILGIPEAWSEGDEEQGRKSVHGHFSIWIKLFNKLRGLLFHEDRHIRDKAREELTKYVGKTMCATYGDLEIVHECDSTGRTGVSEQNQILETITDQEIRDLRHKDHCYKLAGKMAMCRECVKQYSTQDIVNMLLTRWTLFKDTDISNMNISSFPVTKEILDVFAIRHMYDLSSETSHSTQSRNLQYDEQSRNSLLQLRFNEHDWAHRPS